MTDREAPVALGVVRAVCRVAELHPDDGSDGVTAIDKRVVDGPVPVGPDGVRGDVQVSRKHHGGADKAVYALDVVESEHWAAELGRPVPPGLFGENLVLDVRVDDAELGERWRIGQRLEVELTGPRTPCGTFARWLGQEGWVQRYTRRGRPGAYLRVVTPGPVQAGDPVVLLHSGGSSARQWRTGSSADASPLWS